MHSRTLAKHSDLKNAELEAKAHELWSESQRRQAKHGQGQPGQLGTYRPNSRADTQISAATLRIIAEVKAVKSTINAIK